MRGSILGLLAACSLVVAVSACDSRLRETRSRLSGDELALFDRGTRLSTPCWACHDFYGTQNKIAPHLSGLYGRQAGVSTFPAYSQALRASQIVWDDQTLDRFLADPQRLVPGTTMVSAGLASAADRAALRFYIKQVTR
jgi:cytochrome c